MLLNMDDTLKKIQKETGIKMGRYDNEHNRLYNACQMSIIMLENIWKDIQANNLQNSQFVLDWLDKTNKISTRN